MAEEEPKTPTSPPEDSPRRELPAREEARRAQLRWAVLASLAFTVAVLLLLWTNEVPLQWVRPVPPAPLGVPSAADAPAQIPPVTPPETPPSADTLSEMPPPDDTAGDSSPPGDPPSGGPAPAGEGEGDNDESSDDEPAGLLAAAAAERILKAARAGGEAQPLACLAQEGQVLQTWPVCVCLAEALLAGEKELSHRPPASRPWASPHGTVDWELAFTEANARRMLEVWRLELGEDRLGQIVRRSLILDLFLILAYVVGITALCRLAARAFTSSGLVLWRSICWLPALAGLLDLLENLALYAQLERFLAPETAWPPVGSALFTSIIACGKFAALATSLLALTVVFFAWLGRRGVPSRNPRAVGEEEVFADEVRYLEERRTRAGVESRSHDIGLALSGGGLRSATINLGALQALSRHRRLPQFDYLSTVSGGGYIGSALSSLLSINRERLAAAPHGGTEQYGFAGRDEPWFTTRPERFPFNPDNEEDLRKEAEDRAKKNPAWKGVRAFGGRSQMRHQRAAGRFLIPKTNPLSIEMLRVIGGGLGGILYHLLHFGLLMVAFWAGYLAVVYWMVGQWATRTPPPGSPLSVAATADSPLLEQYTRFIKDAFGYNQPGEWWTHPFFFAALVGFATMLIIINLWPRLLDGVKKEWFDRPGVTADSARNWDMALAMTVTMVLLLGWIVLIAWYRTQDREALLNISVPLFSFLGGGACLGIFHGRVMVVRERFTRPDRSRLAAQEGAFVLMTVISLIFVLLVLPFLVFFDAVVDYLEERPLRSLFGWILTLLGARAFAGGKSEGGAKGLIGKAVDFVPGLRKVLFSVVVVLAVLGAGLQICVLIWRYEPDGAHLPTRLVIFGVALALYLATGLLDFNRLALNSFYRDRLAEAFLRTLAPESRAGDSLLPLRDGEHIRLRDLHGRRAGGKPETCVTSAPYHLVVTCLNLTGGSGYERQATRQNDQFVFSKLYCGSESSGYLKTSAYRDGETRLAEAMTISGAAASPAMGEQTFFGQSVAMTLFNVRLGQWMENPSHVRRTGGMWDRWPLKHLGRRWSFWPPYLSKEILASSDADKRLVYLSDGGHSGDNLGIYPLLKRRCRLIVAVDAEYDPQCSCDSLVEALRQISIDEGIEVSIDLRRLRPDPETGISASHFVTGEIDYPDGKKGWLIVIKSTLTHDEPEVIANYKRGREAFPHQATGDLFFDDAQFEAYRRLGWHMAEDMLKQSAVCRAELKKAP